MIDPFEVLGIRPDATQHEIHAVWRKLAKQYHPDTGGDERRMILLNEAFKIASSSLRQSEQLIQTVNQGPTTPSGQDLVGERTRRVRHDVSSFTFNVLPVESFPLIEIVAASVGAIIESDCPYLIEFTLESLGDVGSSSDWCRCELVPEAGGTMVHLTIGGLTTSAVPGVEFVRDVLIDCVNELDEVSLAEQQPW
jgi:hypothetical protein